jgi:hypothetical protein
LSLYPEVGTCHQDRDAKRLFKKWQATRRGMSVLLIDVVGEMDTRQEGVEICDGQVLCVEVSVNGFNGVETGLLVPASKDP